MTTDSKPRARPWAPVWPECALGHDDLALAAEGGHQGLGDGRAHELVVGREEAVHVDLVERRDQRIHVDDGMPASIIFCTGAVSVPIPKAWIATKSHFWEAMLSMAARCLTASSCPSNQVTSTL